MDQFERIAFKIVVIGEPAVGKTSIIRRFSDNSFSENYKATVGADFDIKILKLYDNEIFLTIWDIGSQERFVELRNYYFSGADAAILVFSVDDMCTLKALEDWDSDFLKVSDIDTPRIVVGNKVDLVDKEELNIDKALEFATERGLKLILTSAKTNFNIEKAFKAISELCIKRYNISTIN
ncbi:MAG: Rab family GTPase [Candidatus Helarchaeota archaeon]